MWGSSDEISWSAVYVVECADINSSQRVNEGFTIESDFFFVFFVWLARLIVTHHHSSSLIVPHHRHGFWLIPNFGNSET